MAPLLSKRFIGCHGCGCLTPIVLPERGDAADIVAAYVEDWHEFFAVHAPHGLSEFSCPIDTPVSGGPIWDPMAPLVFEVCNGATRYLVRAHRTSVEAPRRYDFAPGNLRVEPGVVELDENDVRRALDMELATDDGQPERHERHERIDALLRAMHASLDGIDADELEIAFEDADDPEVTIAALPDPALQRILDAVAEIFEANTQDRVARFLRENRGEDGVLALRIRRRAVAVSI